MYLLNHILEHILEHILDQTISMCYWINNIYFDALLEESSRSALLDQVPLHQINEQNDC